MGPMFICPLHVQDRPQRDGHGWGVHGRAASEEVPVKLVCHAVSFNSRPAAVLDFFFPILTINDFSPLESSIDLGNITLVGEHVLFVPPDIDIGALDVTSRHPCSQISHPQASAKIGEHPVGEAGRRRSLS